MGGRGVRGSGVVGGERGEGEWVEGSQTQAAWS